MKRLVTSIIVLGSLMAAHLLVQESQAVGTRRIALRGADVLAEGELEGVAVDSAGRVRTSFDLGNIEVPDASSVWSALEVGQNRLLLATGNDGKLFEVTSDSVKEVAKADALVLTSLVQGWDGRVFVGSLPGGKIYEYAGGKLSEWLTLEETEHVLQLAFDPKTQVLFAATGPEGRLFRIGKDKKPQVYFDADEEHLASVTVAGGRVYVGGGDKAKLYELSAPGRAHVLYDFGVTEVRAIRVSKDGDVYAIANDIKAGRQLPKSKDDEAKPSKSASSRGSGALYRFDKLGAPEELLSNRSELFVSLELDDQGKPYVGTGSEGRLYTIDENRNSMLVADIQERQISALVMGASRRYVISSDPAVVHPVREGRSASALWTSKVVDAQLRATFGKLAWVSEGSLQFQTRTGNTQDPDSTWSEWSKVLDRPGKVTSPPARFIQVRARFEKDRNAVLREVTIPLVTDNLRAVVTNVQIENAGTKSLDPADGKLRTSGGPVSGKPNTEVELSWDVENPDKDELRFRLYYQLVGTTHWLELLDPGDKLTKTSYTWQTRDLPEGQYRVRVEVTDELSNPPERVKRHSLESHILTIDNTPPEIVDLRVTGRRVNVRVVDGVGPIARFEASVAGRDEWVPFAPVDGIFDDAQEQFEVDLTSVAPSGPSLVTLRAFDQENNQVVRSVTLR